ncbi:LysM peptidoglycan-binding domain-containing protein [Candidatus Microgenomates bacterium]|nr:LysM peptidoglycan-binding domain-containing protein [Candidatus Microgenomates bacterium]
MDLKDILKAVKLNESLISMVLGALVFLVVGVLIINYFRGIRNTTNSGSTSSIATEMSLPAEYSVTQGDSLWKIAQKYYGSGYNWVDIATANKLTNPNVISAGQKLTIPKVEAAVATPQTSTVTASTNEKVASPISSETYKVVKGDSLWNIAVRAYGDGYQWTKIYQENKTMVKNPNLIYPDQEFKLPRTSP